MSLRLALKNIQLAKAITIQYIVNQGPVNLKYLSQVLTFEIGKEWNEKVTLFMLESMNTTFFKNNDYYELSNKCRSVLGEEVKPSL